MVCNLWNGDRFGYLKLMVEINPQPKLPSLFARLASLNFALVFRRSSIPFSGQPFNMLRVPGLPSSRVPDSNIPLPLNELPTAFLADEFPILKYDFAA